MMKTNNSLLSVLGKKIFFQRLIFSSFSLVASPELISTSCPSLFRTSLTCSIFCVPKTIPARWSPLSASKELTKSVPGPASHGDSSSKYVFSKLNIAFLVPNSGCLPFQHGVIPRIFS